MKKTFSRTNKSVLYITADGRTLMNPNGKTVKVRRLTKEAKKAKVIARVTKAMEHRAETQQFTPPLMKAVLARANIRLR